MSSQKFPRKKYETPLHPWKESRIKSERELIKKYGLKNHKEVWKAKTYLGKHRGKARELLAKVGASNPQAKKESDQLLLHLTRIGILPMGSTLDDVLALDTETVLSRRLQTLVYLKGFSSTPYQARQLIGHGHVAVKGKKITVPGYMVGKEEEGQINYTIRSPLNEISHPARPKTEMYRQEAPATLPKEKPAAPIALKPEPAPQPTPQPAPQQAPVPPALVETAPLPLIEQKQEAPAVEKPQEKPAEKQKEHKKKEKKEEGS
jgi:small subunit ribosomal protein S4